MQSIIPALEVLRVSFKWALEFFEKRGKEKFGQKFRIYQEDHEIVYKLITYFLGDEKEGTRLGIDLKKGILLLGPVGCGKTQLMTLMREVPPTDKTFVMKTCRDISFEFGTNGFPALDRYSHLSFRENNTPRIFCFDDLGPENTIKYFGNECNVMGEIILSRYEQFIACGMLTHITTNLTADDMDEYYGSRIRSRLREMLNLISYPATARDKRR